MKTRSPKWADGRGANDWIFPGRAQELFQDLEGLWGGVGEGLGLLQTGW